MQADFRHLVDDPRLEDGAAKRVLAQLLRTTDAEEVDGKRCSTAVRPASDWLTEPSSARLADPVSTKRPGSRRASTSI
jgi:hypothetical protein